MFQKTENAPKYFVTGIDTEIGKTVVSAILVQYFNADYWKPVQSGDLHFTDTKKVQQLVSHKNTVFHPETYRLNTPASPHYAAAIDSVTIQPQKFKIPQTSKPLIVEGAGGLMVPLNSNFLIINLIKQLNIPIILVSKNYLGSINHTILSVKALQAKGIVIAGIIFNGEPNEASESAILEHTGERKLFSVPVFEIVDAKNIATFVEYIKNYNL
ncbi:UNVERIFIED_CONTAM: hypothetical protein GTU68_056017 [Idotea baltica]|nr:hypothetical protein [Idotea baltica]